MTYINSGYLITSEIVRNEVGHDGATEHTRRLELTLRCPDILTPKLIFSFFVLRITWQQTP